MAKIFTVEFLYQGTPTSALVSVGEKGQDPWFHIRFHDEALDRLLQTGHLRYAGINGYRNTGAYNRAGAKELLESLGMEIESYLIREKTIDASTR
ncbi:hypothetical protein V9K67_24930 [Paraflavisolibacter sp. H34]|uniref:hypothetical protein n=1 Tax=Huijunlia imazamoxiresistens TaxID=3127457 RepID=UPI00301ACD5C